jgi:hypothetical protein
MDELKALNALNTVVVYLNETQADCNTHDEHGKTDLTITIETLQRFRGSIHEFLNIE